MVDALESLIRALSDHTVPRAELVAAVEKIAQKSPTMKKTPQVDLQHNQ